MAEEKKKDSVEIRRRMEYLTELLNKASEAYYARDTEIMSNLEYDALYDELRALEEKTGVVLSGSPTVQVGYAAVEELPRVRQRSPEKTWQHGWEIRRDFYHGSWMVSR